MTKFYVYVDWTLEENPRPFYVGKGKIERVNLLKRNKRHDSIANSYGIDRRIALETQDEKEAFELEASLILEYRTYAYGENCWGANFTRGGEGSSGRHLTEESLSKIRKPHGPKHSLEQKEKWSNLRKGSHISDSHKENIRLASLGRNHSEDTRQNLREISSQWWKERRSNPDAPKLNYKVRPVQQIDPASGSIVNVYISVAEAFRSTGCSNIHKCCRGLRKTAGGYNWKYVDQNELDNE